MHKVILLAFHSKGHSIYIIILLIYIMYREPECRTFHNKDKCHSVIVTENF